MTEQKKKTKRTYQAKKKLRTSRRSSARKTESGPERRTYRAETIGMPPLKMILVHAQNDRANEEMKPMSKAKSKTLSQQEVVIKIIEHLTKAQ